MAYDSHSNARFEALQERGCGHHLVFLRIHRFPRLFAATILPRVGAFPYSIDKSARLNKGSNLPIIGIVKIERRIVVIKVGVRIARGPIVILPEMIFPPVHKR